MSIINICNSVNHFILHRIMGLRYRMRKSPAIIQCIICMEAGLVRTGLIFHGRSAKGLHQRG